MTTVMRTRPEAAREKSVADSVRPADDDSMNVLEIRPYTSSDEDQWIRCRALAFLYTAYYDDVTPTKPVRAQPSVELVALRGSTLVGVIDAETDGSTATIHTIAVHPDHQGQGVGGRLLKALLERLRELKVSTLDAWTRDDADTLAWYQARGFTDHDHYVHVQAGPDEGPWAVRPLPGFSVVKAFLHADLTDQEWLRERFRRVYVCRRFTRPVDLRR